MKKLNKIKKIEDIRTIWKDEARNFTPWLAKKENLEQLGDALGLKINLIEVEKKVGGLNLDIFAEDETEERKIIIENQIENADHKHLGQLVSYAAGLDAKIVIWVVSGAREEYRKVIDWLNEITDETMHFFIVKIEVFDVGGNLAPHFQILSQPNDWAKSLKKFSKGEMREIELENNNFWYDFRTYCEENDVLSQTSFNKPQGHRLVFSLGKSKVDFWLRLARTKGECSCEVRFNGNDDLFEKLKEQKEKINTHFENKIIWSEKENEKLKKIFIKKKFNLNTSEGISVSYQWFAENIELFIPFFKDLLQKM